MATGRHRVIKRKLIRTGGPVAALVVGLGMLVALLGITGPAFAAPTTAVTITQVTPATQESGETFEYAIGYQCSDVDGADCTNGVITIPLGAAADFDVDVAGGTSIVQSWTVDGAGNLVITLQPSIDAGTSSSITLSVVPPNYETPDGTSWTLEPTITGSNTPPATAPAVSSTATAELVPTITKSRSRPFRRPGQELTWTVRVACQLQDSGSLYATSMVVTDELPDGFTYATSSGGGIYSAGPPATVTWTYPDEASLPTSCTDGTSGGFIDRTITGTVTGTPGVVITNNVTVAAVPLGQTDPITRDASANVTIVDDFNPPGTEPVPVKTGFGQLAGPLGAGDPRLRDFQSTYPGHWTQLHGWAQWDQGSHSIQTNSGPTSAFYTEIYGVSGFGNVITEPMPCLDNVGPGGVTYQSPAPGAGCANPAFHATAVQLSSLSDPSEIYPPASLEVHALLSDGVTVIDLTKVGVANWEVPAAYVGQIAEIRVDRWELDANDVAQVWIEGYADQSLTEGDVLENRLTVQQYFGADLQSTKSDTGNIYIVNGPQIGVGKSFGSLGAGPGGTTAVSLQGKLTTLGTATEDLVLSDLLPEGMRWDSAPSSLPSSMVVKESSGTSTVPVNLVVDVVENYQGTGRQLVRFTVPEADLAAFAPSSAEDGTEFNVEFTFNVTTPAEAGVYNNTVSAYYDRSDLSPVCASTAFSPAITQISSDPSDLNDNGSTTDNHCDATDSVTVPGSLSGPEFKVTKTVQGDQDAAPKQWPGIGQVDATGGSVTFGINWKNVAAKPINDVVLYDVFPHVGDTGVSGSLAGQPRNSEFDATFVAMGPLPAGVSVEYTTATNPCRDEVYPDASNPGCVDDWSATVPADPADVTGIRVLAPGTYTAGQGFGLTYTMTTPSIDQGDVAWNSVAGVADNAENGVRMLVTEPPKVGLTAAGEDPIIGKEVDLTTAEPGDTLTYTVTLTNPASVNATGLTVTDTLPDGVTFVSASDSGAYDAGTGVITWTGLSIPGNGEVELTVQVTVDAGFTGTLENCASSPQAVPTETCATTTVDDGVLVVEKVVDGPAASYAVGPFDFTVDCRVGGSSLTGFPMDLSLPAAGTSSPIDVPLGAVCTAVETDDGGATSTTITPAGGVEITDSTSTFTLTATNTFEEGSLVINKQLTGAGAAAFGAGPFEFDVTCDFEGATVLDDTVTLTRVASETTLTSDPIDGLPSGAVCTVTETENGGADLTPAPVIVTIDDTATAATVYADLTNVFSAGTVQVTKELAGPADQSSYVAGLQFTLQVTCQVDTEDASGDPIRATVHSGPVTIRGGETIPVTDVAGDPVPLPLGTHCWAEETDAQGADGVEIDHDSWADAVVVTDGTPADLQELTLTATNRFELRVPSYVTTVSDKAVMVGDTVTDRVRVTGLVPGESVEVRWQLYGPYAARADMTCKAGKVYADGTMTVSANGTVTTPEVKLRKAGFYTYVQSSRATDTYAAQRTACGIAAETTRVQEGEVTVRTVSSEQKVIVGESVTDKVVIKGLPAGTKAKVTGHLYGPFETEKAIRCTPAHAYAKVRFTATGNPRGKRIYRTDRVRILEPGWFSWSMDVPRTALTAAATEGCGVAPETVLATRKVMPNVIEVPTGLRGDDVRPDDGTDEITFLDQVADLVDAADGVVDGNITAGDPGDLPVLPADQVGEALTSGRYDDATQPGFAVEPRHTRRLYSPPNGVGVRQRKAPTGLSIPSIGVTAPIDTSRLVGTTMAVPSSVGRVGWLNRSAHLDDVIGSTVIAGHVSDHHDSPGALYRLKSVRVGDVITVTEKGRRHRFRVTRLRTYDRSGHLPAEIFTVTGKHVLNLITCTGKVTYPGGGFHYTKNLVVTAEALR